MGSLTFQLGGRVKSGFELKTTCFDTIINYHLSQKLKLFGNDEFNHLNIIQTRILFEYIGSY